MSIRDNHRALKAAYLSSLGYTQLKIADRLDVNESQVGRWVRQAREEGLLRTHVEFAHEQISSEKLRELELFAACAEGLQTALQAAATRPSAAPIVHVFDSDPGELVEKGASNEQRWDLRLKVFGDAVAAYIRAHLFSPSTVTCGVMWGRTVECVIGARGLERSPNPARRGERGGAEPLNVIPLAGEPAGKRESRFSASALASHVNHLVNKEPQRTLSLSAVPLFIPSGLSVEEARGVWKLTGCVEDYWRIFGSERLDDALGGDARTAIFGSAPPGWADVEPIVDDVDMILTSVGREDEPLGYISKEPFRTTGIDKAALRKLIVGDVAGVLIPRPRLSAKDKDLFNSVVTRTTCLTMAQLEACANKARDLDGGGNSKKVPGVVVAACGKSKAAVIFAAVKRDLISKLFVDAELAEELVRLAPRLRCRH